MEQTVPYIDKTQRDVPFIDFMIPVNPPVRVSTVYARQTALLSERDHQMCLVKLANLGDLYGTEIFAVDKVTGEMYAVIDGAAKSIDLQATCRRGNRGIRGSCWVYAYRYLNSQRYGSFR